MPKPITVRVALDPEVHRLLRMLAARAGTTHSVVVASLVGDRARADGLAPPCPSLLDALMCGRDEAAEGVAP
jgi:hypothetical protein